MLAETAYNVIEALSEKEKERLFGMLKLSERAPKNKRVKVLDDSQAKEFLIQKLNAWKRQRS